MCYFNIPFGNSNKHVFHYAVVRPDLPIMEVFYFIKQVVRINMFNLHIYKLITVLPRVQSDPLSQKSLM